MQFTTIFWHSFLNELNNFWRAQLCPQMTPWTHSDSLNENEVLSGLSKSFFKNRRKRVISKMLERMPEETKLKPLAEMEGKKWSLRLSKITDSNSGKLWYFFDGGRIPEVVVRISKTPPQECKLQLDLIPNNLINNLLQDQERNEFVMIVPSASDKLMSSGTYYPFVQDSNFHYLTGFVEPDAILVVSTVKGSRFSISS